MGNLKLISQGEINIAVDIRKKTTLISVFKSITQKKTEKHGPTQSNYYMRCFEKVRRF